MEERDIYQPFTRQRELLAVREHQRLVALATAQRGQAGWRLSLARIGKHIYALLPRLYNQRPDFKPVEKPAVLKSELR